MVKRYWKNIETLQVYAVIISNQHEFQASYLYLYNTNKCTYMRNRAYYYIPCKKSCGQNLILHNAKVCLQVFSPTTLQQIDVIFAFTGRRITRERYTAKMLTAPIINNFCQISGTHLIKNEICNQTTINKKIKNTLEMLDNGK